MRRVALAAAAIPWLLAAQSPRPGVLDDFRDRSGWTAHPAEGVDLQLSGADGSEGPGGALRLDFDFAGHAGWAAVRKSFPLRLPANFAFHLRLRGETGPQTLEFKLLDAGGENVWWSVRRDFAFPRDWTTLSIRRRQISFAWGPAGGGDLHELASIEIAITAASGGRGTVWLDELDFEELPAEPPGRLVAKATASSQLDGSPAEAAVDGNPATAWRSGRGDEQRFTLDLGARRELGGLVLDWDEADYPRQYDVLLSSDGAAWEKRREIRPARGGRAFLSLPDSDGRFVRLDLLRSARGAGYALAEASIEPPAFSETPTRFLQAVAAKSPTGTWPRSFAGQQLYWTLVGVDGGRDKGLLSEDGTLEVGRGGFSLEPFVQVSGSLLGWKEASTTRSLERGDLPIPSVTRRYPDGLSLEVTAFADGPFDGSTLRARYRLVNSGRAAVNARLVLAVRPLQVNPPEQFLNLPGGFAAIHRLRQEGRGAVVEGRRIEADPPFAFGAASWGSGEIVDRVRHGALPPETAAEDPDGFASGAFAWDLSLPPGRSRDVRITAPFPGSAASSPAQFEARLSQNRREWEQRLDRVHLDLPPAAAPAGRTLWSSLAWMLVERDGAAIQPGARSYARSWIRDGAMMSEALLRLAHREEVRDYLEWYAPRLLPDGRVPCCVDRRGADPVPENDSAGELLHLAAEYFRFTRDRATLLRVWPHIDRAAAFLDSLRRQRRTVEYQSGEKRLFFGLLPESISHEGYSAHPVHSYWDDFWGVLGLSDAAWLAGELGRVDEARRLSDSADQMRRDVHDSIRRVIAARGIDYIPGSADLADLDATSTTIALAPGREGATLPPKELHDTFERYWKSFQARVTGESREDAYTPYEWRIVGSFVRLGWRDRAAQLFGFLMKDRRPPEWNQWPEVVARDPRAPRFLGDLPHGWVASDFIRSMLDLFAWERAEDDAVVLASGIPDAWLEHGGAALRSLRTPRGTLDVGVRRDARGVRVTFASTGRVPAGGYVLRPPLPEGIRSVVVNGRPSPFAGLDVVVRQPSATVLFTR